MSNRWNPQGVHPRRTQLEVDTEIFQFFDAHLSTNVGTCCAKSLALVFCEEIVVISSLAIIDKRLAGLGSRIIIISDKIEILIILSIVLQLNYL